MAEEQKQGGIAAWPAQAESQDEIVPLEGGGWVNRTVINRFIAQSGPQAPDDPGVAFDPETQEGKATLRDYLDQRGELYRQLDAEWERQHPGVEFRRLCARIRPFEMVLAEIRAQQARDEPVPPSR